MRRCQASVCQEVNGGKGGRARRHLQTTARDGEEEGACFIHPTEEAAGPDEETRRVAHALSVGEGPDWIAIEIRRVQVTSAWFCRLERG